MSGRGPRPYKLVLIGNCGVGKTSIITRLISNEFYVQVRNTVGHANFDAVLNVNGAPVEFNIWDTAGQEAYQCLTPSFLRGSDVCMIVASITDPSSLTEEAVQKWRDKVSESDSDPALMLLINKMDMSTAAFVSRAAIEARFSERYPNIFFVSAQSGDKIVEAFLAAGLAAKGRSSDAQISQMIDMTSDEKSECC
jgi:small GTP-binding protein